MQPHVLALNTEILNYLVRVGVDLNLGTWFLFSLTMYQNVATNWQCMGQIQPVDMLYWANKMLFFSRNLEQTFQNTEISHKIWIPEFSWKSRGPGAQAQHSMAATSQSRQPLFWWIFHSAVISTLCYLPGTEAECPLPLIFAMANCISHNSEIFSGNYISSKWQKTKNWNGWMFQAECVEVI